MKDNSFLLINSPIFWNASTDNEEYLSPLGLAYIATYLKKADINVKLIDCVKEKISVNRIIDIINNEKPSAVGINIFTQNYELVKYIVESICITTTIFIGGQTVKSIYNDIIFWNVKNRLNIIIGEGELILPDLALNRCLENPVKVNGNKYVYRVNNDSVYFPKDISNIFIDRCFLENEIVKNHYGEKEAAIVTSRGCLYNCAFCGGARGLNNDIKIRIRNSDSIIREIDEIISIYPEVQSIRILDDLFLRNKQSIDSANQIFSTFSHLSWRGMAHVLSFTKCMDDIKKLSKSNCKELFIGIESGSNVIREKINKLGSVKDIIDVSTKILEHGIDLKGYFIFGFPDETEDNFKETYNLAYKIKEISNNTPGDFRTSVFQFRPYNGTQLYNEIVKKFGIPKGCFHNKELSGLSGRSQFNFSFGNYSLESNECLNEYIINTQKLSEI